ncbi:uncharacterized protein TRIVIDRAFT_65061 [Trichoderma virens Gv29-8]|uniref:Uncharacterized protein n=1 Tax=Hypocrea virens (strain Gv29-8 / FGSC 10586) TaxID=413071 RepID=G9NBB2_HYPVG|nr:uncharacterized protein TRIVIDRAFT_65061 [Trichoderma virens Gv29-8]EHK16119.1 hypothetical protein TRIVIDRAFT_65061 [Trichoderma virens Gv29-8]UKZ56103.1 hypothetical protein TrVGV298_009931 [Trichoderma virens]
MTLLPNCGGVMRGGALQRFIKAQPTHATLDALLPMKELPLKLELIRELEKLVKTDLMSSDNMFHFTNLQLSALSVMSIDTLQDLVKSLIRCLHIISHYTPQLQLPLLIQGKLLRCESRGVPQVSESSDNNIHQSANESEKCYLRDQRACVLTKATDARACAIIPFTLTASQENISTFTNSMFYSDILGHTTRANIGRIMHSQPLGGLNKSWNMLCLHPTLCTWWSQCLFGLKYLGFVTNGDGSSVAVQIQFYWMPRNWVKPQELAEPPYDEAIDAMLQTVVADEQRDSFPDLESGKIFEVLIDNEEEALKMKVALECQWVAVRIAALSGAARVWDLGLDVQEDADVYDTGSLDSSDSED